MSKVVVDPKLFIICRLCLEDTGLYQIVPDIQQKIAFCFGIKVELFDGLSQLICKSCEAVLCNYAEIKQRFIDQQKKLKDLTLGSNVSIPSLQEEKQSICEDQNTSKENEKCSVTSSINPAEDNESNIIPHWKKDYLKKFICILCDAQFSSKTAFKFHNLRIHSTFKGKYSKVFKKHCQVILPRIDRKTNLTGSYKKVVYSTEKIIENCSSDYYITYLRKKTKLDSKNDCSSPISNNNTNYDSSDSSNSDSVIQCTSRRKRRIDSTSSHDTVLLENKLDKETISEHSIDDNSDVDCIDVDDETYKDDRKVSKNKNSVKRRKSNSNTECVIAEDTIMKIITNCETKFYKKFDFSSNGCSGVLLRRKILSVGRKIINKKGFNSTALLRFLEHRNLDVVWLVKPAMTLNNESNYVKILTKIKQTKPANKFDDDTGWIDYCTPAIKPDSIIEDSAVTNNKSQKSENQSNVANIDDSAVLYSILTHDSKKILNANPVANPKQLPKKVEKLVAIAPKVIPKTLIKKTETANIVVSNPISIRTSTDDNFGMPIITSTTSLAVFDNDEKKVEGPRIKIKPLTELMSKETLNRLNNPPTIITTENLTNNFVLANTPYSLPMIEQNIPNVMPIITNTISEASKSSEKNKDYLILDSVLMPNRKTNSPFEYFKTLLHMHNIVLLDTNIELTKDFNCLIKFKVLFKQESKEQPVILCLSLYVDRNIFCVKIKDRNQEDIDISKISANWQWEILKIFRDDVVTKLLANANKISPDVYSNASTFVYAFKSIKFVKMVTDE